MSVCVQRTTQASTVRPTPTPALIIRVLTGAPAPSTATATLVPVSVDTQAPHATPVSLKSKKYKELLFFFFTYMALH